MLEVSKFHECYAMFDSPIKSTEVRCFYVNISKALLITNDHLQRTNIIAYTEPLKNGPFAVSFTVTQIKLQSQFFNRFIVFIIFNKRFNVSVNFSEKC
jgi:hypothetical protein